jgi:hypothetical protein
MTHTRGKIISPIKLKQNGFAPQLSSSASIYQNGIYYDNRPGHINWRIDNQIFSDFFYNDQYCPNFEYWLELGSFTNSNGFRSEVFSAVKKLSEVYGSGMTFAVCLSGGIDSEIIIRAMKLLGLKFQAYFLSFWNQNIENYECFIKPIESELGFKTNILVLNKDMFINKLIYEHFELYGCELPTYLAMLYLFDKIPKHECIVVGEGDLDKQGALYTRMSNSIPKMKNGCIPFTTSEVLYRIWSQKNRRYGEYYFFSSTEQLIVSVLKDVSLRVQFPHVDTKEVIYSNFPEIKRRRKTNNWEGENFKLNKEIRSRLFSYAQRSDKFKLWAPACGSFQDLSQIIDGPKAR